MAQIESMNKTTDLRLMTINVSRLCSYIKKQRPTNFIFMKNPALVYKKESYTITAQKGWPKVGKYSNQILNKK